MDLEEVNELVGEGGGISLAPSPPAPAPAPAAASFARPSGTLGTQSEIDELRSQTERLQQTVRACPVAYARFVMYNTHTGGLAYPPHDGCTRARWTTSLGTRV
jgi:hypothetical protein